MHLEITNTVFPLISAPEKTGDPNLVCDNTTYPAFNLKTDYIHLFLESYSDPGVS